MADELEDARRELELEQARAEMQAAAPVPPPAPVVAEPTPVPEPEPRPETSQFDAGVMGWRAGATGDWDDEIGGLGQGMMQQAANAFPKALAPVADIFGVETRYAQDAEDVRTRGTAGNRLEKKNAEEDHPGTYGVTHVAGDLTAQGIAAMATGGASLTPAGQAAIGAIAGAGNAEGTGNRIEGALTGAGTGYVGAVAANQILQPVVGAATRAVTNRYGSLREKLLKEAEQGLNLESRGRFDKYLKAEASAITKHMKAVRTEAAKGDAASIKADAAVEKEQAKLYEKVKKKVYAEHVASAKKGVGGTPENAEAKIAAQIEQEYADALGKHAHEWRDLHTRIRNTEQIAPDAFDEEELAQIAGPAKEKYIADSRARVARGLPEAPAPKLEGDALKAEIMRRAKLAETDAAAKAAAKVTPPPEIDPAVLDAATKERIAALQRAGVAPSSDLPPKFVPTEMSHEEVRKLALERMKSRPTEMGGFHTPEPWIDPARTPQRALEGGGKILKDSLKSTAISAGVAGVTGAALGKVFGQGVNGAIAGALLGGGVDAATSGLKQTLKNPKVQYAIAGRQLKAAQNADKVGQALTSSPAVNATVRELLRQVPEEERYRLLSEYLADEENK